MWRMWAQPGSFKFRLKSTNPSTSITTTTDGVGDLQQVQSPYQRANYGSDNDLFSVLPIHPCSYYSQEAVELYTHRRVPSVPLTIGNDQQMDPIPHVSSESPPSETTILGSLLCGRPRALPTTTTTFPKRKRWENVCGAYAAVGVSSGSDDGRSVFVAWAAPEQYAQETEDNGNHHSCFHPYCLHSTIASGDQHRI